VGYKGGRVFAVEKVIYSQRYELSAFYRALIPVRYYALLAGKFHDARFIAVIHERHRHNAHSRSIAGAIRSGPVPALALRQFSTGLHASDTRAPVISRGMIPFYKFLGYGIRVGESGFYYGLGQRHHHLRIVGVLSFCQMSVRGMRAGRRHIGHRPAVYALYIIMR
jgi:hypothetical protein